MTDIRNIKLSNDLFSDAENLDEKNNLLDILRHDEIAENLKEIVSNVDTPANVALFGAWGSGKTWICKQLERKIEEKNGKISDDKNQKKYDTKSSIGYVRYDAFKYVELPLLRTFIKVVAKSVLEEREFSDIRQEVNNSSEISQTKNTPFKNKWEIFGAIAATAILVSILISYTKFQEYGAFVAAIIALLTYFFGTRQVSHRKLGPKDSDEFEELFRSKIIEKMKYDRLVIFIDELDRCSAKEMIKTLDVVRAFFDIEKCIIVVAVDRSVIEQALEQEARQSTPNDEDHPYYSTGGAYLEKVFQYQITIPPLWRYQGRECAKAMVKRKIKKEQETDEVSEFWKKVVDQNELETLSEILIPDYVTSPRRVKNLLNTFVILCHIAEAKKLINIYETYSKEDIRTLAKFACLKVEFPMFARDMLKDPRLPQYVLQHLMDPVGSVPSEIDDAVWGIAKGYANKSRAASRFISDKSGAVRSLSKIDKVHGQNLLNYLSSTENIKCPSFKLVYFDRKFSDNFKLGILREDKIIRYASMGRQKQGFLREISKLKKDELSTAVSVLLSHFKGESTLNDGSILTSILSIPSNSISLIDKNVIDKFVEISLFYSIKNSAFLEGNTPSLIWNLCQYASEQPRLKMRKRIIKWINSLEEVNMNNSAFIIRDLDVSFDIYQNGASNILVRLLNSDEWQIVIDSLFFSSDQVIEATLAALDKYTKENSISIRYDMLRALPNASFRKKKSIQEQVLSILVFLKLEDTCDAVDTILSNDGFMTNQTEVLTYVFNALLKSVVDNASLSDIKMYEKWMEHVSVDNIDEVHIRLLKDLYLKTIGTPEIALREENKAIADLLNNFISDLRQPGQGNVKAEIGKLLKQHSGKLSRESAQVTMQYNDMLRGYDLLDQTQEASDLFYGALEIIENPVAESDASTEAIGLLSEKLRGEFIELSPCFTEKQIFKLLQALMRCTWIENEEVNRVTLIKEASDIIDRLPEQDVERVDFSAVISQLKHYPDKAVESTLKWMKRFKNPYDAALVFRTLVEMDLLKTSNFSLSLGSLYRSWQDEQAKVFWNECFKYVASSGCEDEEDNILALLAWGENVDMGHDEKRFVDWLVEQSRRSLSLKERRLLLLLMNNAHINDRSSRIKLINAIIFPLFDVSGRPDYRDVLLGIKEVEKISRDVFEDVSDQVEGYLKQTLGYFPELWLPIERAARYWNLSLDDESRSA